MTHNLQPEKDENDNLKVENSQLLQRISNMELELRKLRRSTSWRVTKPLRFAGAVVRKVTPLPIKRRVRSAYDVARKVPRQLKMSLDPESIRYGMRMRGANRAIANRQWGQALTLWKKILESRGQLTPLELMHFHRERSSIAMLELLKDMTEYKSRIRKYNQAKKANKTQRIAVYTAITGGYDKLKVPKVLDDRFDYYVFSDGPVIDTGIYNIRPIPYIDKDSTRSARFIKTHPHILFPDYDTAIWIDANIMINGDISPLVDEFLASKKQIAAIPHPLREYIFEEVKACVALNKDDEDVILAQAEKYERIGLSDKGLIESNLMMFNLGDKKTSNLLDVWWREINQYSRRDQISLMFAIKESKSKWHHIMERPMNTRSHPLFVLMPHSTNERLQQIVLDEISTKTKNPYDVKFTDNLDKEIAKKKIDVVVCVHNARDDVEICLEAIKKYKENNHSLIIIDDGSDAPTRDYLKQFSTGKSWVTLHRNEQAGGYTKAANKGISLSTGDLVIMLNSDTVPTKGWVEKMAKTIFSTPRGGIVGPLSSAASHQSIPDHLSSKTQTAVNGLPEGVSVEKMNSYCELWSKDSIKPLVPLVHGFCFGITREVISTIGSLDEKAFPKGYGEETDYCFRATDAGFSLVIATDTYIYHTKSKSYDDAKRIELMRLGSEKLKEIYGSDRLQRSIVTMQANPLLVHMRSEAKKLY